MRLAANRNVEMLTSLASAKVVVAGRGVTSDMVYNSRPESPAISAHSLSTGLVNPRRRLRNRLTRTHLFFCGVQQNPTTYASERDQLKSHFCFGTRQGREGAMHVGRAPFEADKGGLYRIYNPFGWTSSSSIVSAF